MQRLVSFLTTLGSKNSCTMDKELGFLEKINHRDISAYKILYEDYYNALVMYSVNFVGRLNVAEDIVQELFVAIWEKRITFLSFVSFRVYLYNAVRNASIDYLKHQDIEEQYISSVSDAYREISVEQDLQEEEIRRLLYREIDGLPEKMREIFLMYMDGRKNEEIASILQISVETVKTQKKRAVKQIKSKLGSLFYFFSIFEMLP